MLAKQASDFLGSAKFFEDPDTNQPGSPGAV